MIAITRIVNTKTTKTSLNVQAKHTWMITHEHTPNSNDRCTHTASTSRRDGLNIIIDDVCTWQAGHIVGIYHE